MLKVKRLNTVKHIAVYSLALLLSGCGYEYNCRQWSGACVSDKPDGQGFYTSEHGKYSGVFTDGEPEAQGEFIYHDGGKYTGELKNTTPNGQGKLTYAKDNKALKVNYTGAFISINSWQ